jgi:hypothetical protein
MVQKLSALLLLGSAALGLCSTAPLTPIADTTLFSIPLSSDSTKLFFADKQTPIRRSLSGPVLMQNSTLLFYSTQGYVLYDTTGSLLDSHSVATMNEKAAKGGQPLWSLAHPIDPATLLYYRKSTGGKRSSELMLKTLQHKRLREVADEQYPILEGATRAHLFNIAHNTQTDDMASRVFHAPQLIGINPQSQQQHWWALERFYAFCTPLLQENNGTFEALFPGFKQDGSGFQGLGLDAVGIFERAGVRYYMGLLATMGNKQQSYSQMLYGCDEAGNLFFVDTLLKQENMDEILGKDANPHLNLYYTTKATRRYVFTPALTQQGGLFYGIIDYENRSLSCHLRRYRFYQPTDTVQNLAHALDMQRMISWEPVALSCTNPQQLGAQLPTVFSTDASGKRSRLETVELSVNNYVVRLGRTIDRSLDKKLERSRALLPPQAWSAVERLLATPNAACPYTISLSGPRGMLGTFTYGAAQTVHSARIVGIDRQGDIAVRVDLDKSAEIVSFAPDGSIRGRFVFNTQPAPQRKDVIAADGYSSIIEQDFEADVKGRYVSWELGY